MINAAGKTANAQAANAAEHARVVLKHVHLAQLKEEN